MEDFFEDESAMYLGGVKEDSIFWDDLLMELDDDNADQSLRLLEELESRDCDEEMKWFDSLLIEETEEDNST